MIACAQDRGADQAPAAARRTYGNGSGDAHLHRVGRAASRGRSDPVVERVPARGMREARRTPPPRSAPRAGSTWRRSGAGPRRARRESVRPRARRRVPLVLRKGRACVAARSHDPRSRRPSDSFARRARAGRRRALRERRCDPPPILRAFEARRGDRDRDSPEEHLASLPSARDGGRPALLLPAPRGRVVPALRLAFSALRGRRSARALRDRGRPARHLAPARVERADRGLDSRDRGRRPRRERDDLARRAAPAEGSDPSRSLAVFGIALDARRAASGRRSSKISDRSFVWLSTNPVATWWLRHVARGSRALR